jgi:hypothetical protein
VNARPARIVAKGIIYGGATDTVFQYMKSDTLGVLTPISPASLPLTHSAVVHGSQADAGTAALIDSIRQVNVQFTTVYHDARTNADTFRRLQLTIHLMNAGLIHHSTCGNQPISVTSPTATVFAANGGTIPQTYVRLTWSPSVDDGGGERDVERYALYRRLTGATTFDQPFASVPGGSPSYTFQDTDIISGQSWIYGVAAQDCTPSSSAVSVTTSVVIP